MKLQELGNPKYIALETFRRDGRAVKTPVLTVEHDGKLLVWTQADSWKVKRAHKNPRVRIAKCDMRGNVTGPWVEGKVTSISSDEDAKKEMARLLGRKYPLMFILMFTLVSLVANLRGENKGNVVMEIENA